ncbi:MAG: Hsp20/alpha crystallin family protein [Chromatiales bacterium]|nr:Hsp20/alpha crystallin family protein [Chromatiales bacterium]
MLGYLGGFDRDVWDRFERARERMDRMFGGWPGTTGIRSVTGESFPPVNVGATPEAVDVFVFVPGVDASKLDVSLHRNLLTIAGERNVDLPEEAQVYRNERFSGTFRRVFSLPDDVDPEQVTAAYRDGVLHVRLQRRAPVTPRKIQVH